MKASLTRIVTKIMGSVAAMALAVAVINANSTCLFWSYQPDVPDELMH